MSATPKKSQGQVSFSDFDFPPPMAPDFLSRSVVHPWREKNYTKPESDLTTNQIWTQLHHNMYELQVIAKEDHHTENNEKILESPFPQ